LILFVIALFTQRAWRRGVSELRSADLPRADADGQAVELCRLRLEPAGDQQFSLDAVPPCSVGVRSETGALALRESRLRSCA
jgi:hypothetical protein